jgi:hypothetical protein
MNRQFRNFAPGLSQPGHPWTNNGKNHGGACVMVDYANAWPNYYVGFAWLFVFIVFLIFPYPHIGSKGGGQK